MFHEMIDDRLFGLVLCGILFSFLALNALSY